MYQNQSFRPIFLLSNFLYCLVDVIRVELPDVKLVTNIRTISIAIEAHARANRSMLSEVHAQTFAAIFNHSSNIEYVRKKLFDDETAVNLFEIVHDRKKN